MTADDINIGIGALLETFEMMYVSIDKHEFFAPNLITVQAFWFLTHQSIHI